MIPTPSPFMVHRQAQWFEPASLWSLTETADGSGGWTSTYVEQGSVAASLSPPTAAERRTAGAEGVEADYVVKAGAGEPLQRTDRLVQGSTTVELVAPLQGTHSAVQVWMAKQEPWDTGVGLE